MNDNSPEPPLHNSTASASHTHLFPGALLRLENMDLLTDPLKLQDLKITFSDGADTQAVIAQNPKEPRQEHVTTRSCGCALVVEPYITAAGTRIPRKTWIFDEHPGEPGEMYLKIGRCLHVDSA